MPTLSDLAVRFAEARRELDVLQDAVKTQQQVVDEVQEALFAAMEDQGIASHRVPGLGLFSLNDLAWARIVDRTAALAWADEHMPELLTLNNQRLSMLVRQHLKGEGELPAGVDFTTSRKITWRKS